MNPVGRLLSFIAIIFIFLSLSCTRSEDSKLTIQLPEAGSFSHGKSLSYDTLSSEESPWNGISIDSSSDVNCYLVAVGGPESIFKRNRCLKKDSGDLAFEFGPFVGGSPGGIIQLSVTPGPARTIYLLGMKADSGYCTSFKINGPPPGKISYPRVVAQVTTDLVPGDNTLPLSVPSDLTNATEVDECEVESGRFEGSPMIALFGNQRDGDLTIASGSFTLGNSGLQYNNVSVTRNSNSNFATVSSTKYFSANMGVASIDNSTGTVLALSEAFTTDHFQPGDEILWHVSQGTHTTSSPDDNACGTGSGLYRGRFGFAKIVAIDIPTNTITLSRAVSQSPANINNSNFSGIGDSSTTHCRMQVLRVPSFDDLTINGATTISPPAYDSGSGVGGILAFRARKIHLNAALDLIASEKGFPGVSGYAGTGAEGLGSAADGTANGAGGGSTVNYGGGGAHAGVGGASYNADAQGGSPILYCIGSTPCLPMTDRKMFFGGSGGAHASYPGGHGGGIIILHAYEVVGSGGLNLRANGQSTSANDAGGGAGGAVHLTNIKYPNTSSLTIEAKGGGNDSDGGGGSGGVIERRVCSLTSTPSTLTESVLGGSSSTGSAGGNGLKDSANATHLCGL